MSGICILNTTKQKTIQHNIAKPKNWFSKELLPKNLNTTDYIVLVDSSKLSDEIKGILLDNIINAEENKITTEISPMKNTVVNKNKFMFYFRLPTAHTETSIHNLLKKKMDAIDPIISIEFIGSVHKTLWVTIEKSTGYFEYDILIEATKSNFLPYLLNTTANFIEIDSVNNPIKLG